MGLRPLPLLVAAEWVGWWRRGRFGSALAALTSAQLLALGALIGMPWFARNAAVYGAGDWFGTRRHDQVVVGQITTAGWIRDHGLGDLLIRSVGFTFKSFWGVFGWMGVFLDARYYAVLAGVSLAAAAGFGLYTAGLAARSDRAAADVKASLGLLGFVAAMTVAGFLWWNLGFVQHQGRYLCPALVPIALGLQLGLRELGLRIGTALRLGEVGTRRLAGLVLVGFALGLAGLAWISLTRYIVPGLS
jgi:hypothetical protein